MQDNTKKSPFQNLLIVDIGGTVACGYAGKMFADYGARVVNLETQEGFSTRQIAPFLENGNSAMHGYLNANKESVVVGDLVSHHPAILEADLIILDPDTLPSSLSIADFDNNVCAISWFGLHGPYSEYQGSDEAIFALTGIMQMLGEPDGPPLIPTGFHTQIVGGLSAFNGALGYLYGDSSGHNKQSTKTKFCIDASIFEANMCLTDLGVLASFNGENLQERLGTNRFYPTYPLGIWPCKDGWLGVTVLNPGQWLAFCHLLGLSDLAAEPEYGSSVKRLEDANIIEPRILEALLLHKAEDLFYKGQAMRIPLARVPTMEEVFSVDQYVHRNAFSEFLEGKSTFIGPSIPFRLFKTPPKLGGTSAPLGAHDGLWFADADNDYLNHQNTGPKNTLIVPDLPLKDLTIVDLSMGWAGPLAARNLADMGATVIKIEGCARFDWFRNWEASQEWIDNDGAEKAINFIYVNRNKLDVTLDFEINEGRELLLKLIESADAVVENYSGGVLPKLNLHYHALKQVNPELVMVSMPAFGSTGPWAKFRAYGSTVEQAAGLPHLQGVEASPPTMLHVAFGDAIAGLYGTAALLTALLHKKNTGEGQFVDLSQAECMLPSAIHGILNQSVLGEAPRRLGNYRPDHYVHGVFPCSGHNNWLLIRIKTDQQWVSAANKIKALFRYNALSADEKRSKFVEIERSLAAWTKENDAKSLMRELRGDGIDATALNSVSNLMDDPHLVSRGYMQFLERDYVGRQPHPSSPWRLENDPICIEQSAPTLGQHNKEVLGGILGLSDADLKGLQENGIIGDKPRLA